MSIIDKLKKWFKPIPQTPLIIFPPQLIPPPTCEHLWHEYKNRDGNTQWRECRKCWSGQSWDRDHWHDVKIW